LDDKIVNVKEGGGEDESKQSEKIMRETEVGKPKNNRFEPGSIHNSEVFSFWKEDLKASPWVLELLQKGYKLPFISLPGHYEERNNASARAEPAVVSKLVKEMIDLKIVKLLDEKPHCVSPLGLVKKLNEDGSIKYRLVFDASRCVNLHLEEKHVTLAHLEKALEMTKRDDFQSIFDLQSCYYHVKIFEDHQKYLGASCKLEGQKRYFVY